MTAAAVDAALEGTEGPARERFAEVWDVWNHKSPAEQVADGLVSDARFVAKFAEMEPETLANLAIFADQMVGKSQDEQHDGLGNRTHHSAWGDVHRDSMLGARFQIDIVVANTATADRTQARYSHQGLRRDFGLQRNQYVIL